MPITTNIDDRKLETMDPKPTISPSTTALFVDKTPYRKGGVRKQLTDAQYTALCKGNTVDIFVGQGKDRAIAVNGAFPPLLMHYSGLAKYILSENERDITLPKVSKESMAYAYSFMLAREQDATILKPKFENLTLQQLAHLHDACNKLQYESLSDKAFNRIKWVIGKKGCSEYDSFKAVYEFVPSLREAIIKAAAKEKLYGGKPEFVGQICEIPGISNSIDAIVKEYEAQVKAEAEALRLAQQASKPAANEISKCKDIRCYTCKQKGHVAKNCRGGKPPKCYKCGFFGHIARNCNSA